MKSCCEREGRHALAAQRAKEQPLGDGERISAIFRVLGDPTRMKIVLALMQGEMCVYHLAEVTGGTVSGVSHQLRVLREHQIVRTNRLGKNIEYAIADEHIREIVTMGIAHAHCKEKI